MPYTILQVKKYFIFFVSVFNLQVSAKSNSLVHMDIKLNLLNICPENRIFYIAIYFFIIFNRDVMIQEICSAKKHIKSKYSWLKTLFWR